MLIIMFMYNLGHLDTQVKPKKATFVSMVAMKQWILEEWTLLPIKNMIFSFDQTQLILEQGIIFSFFISDWTASAPGRQFFLGTRYDILKLGTKWIEYLKYYTYCKKF